MLTAPPPPAPVAPAGADPSRAPGGCVAPGCGVAALGIAGIAYLGIVLWVLSAPESVDGAVAAGSLLSLAAGVAAVVVASGLRRGRGDSPMAFGPAHPLVWLALFAPLLGIGSVVLFAGWPILTAIVFPPLHVLAALTPALTVIAHVAWRAGRPAWLTWSRVTRQMAWGGIVATIGAMIAELLVAVALLAVVVLLLDLTAGGRALLDAVNGVLAQCAGQPTGAGCGTRVTTVLGDLARNPVVVAAAFSLVGIIAPLIEETAKVAGVAWSRPSTRAQAWAFGVSTGAGFGILEAVMIGALGLQPAAWVIAVLVRGCTTLVHATMTGLASIGWHAAASGGPRRTIWTYFGLAVGGHALWNSLVFAAVYATIAGGPSTPTATSVPSPALAMFGTLGVIVLFSQIFAGFARLSERFGAEARAAVGT